MSIERIDAVDLCAGPGGWSSAAHQLGLAEAGIEFDPVACATRRAAGHITVRADIAALDPRPMRGIRGLIGSPPCGGVSILGARRGLGDLGLVVELLGHLASGLDPREQYAAKMADFRSHLMAEPLRYAVAMRPEWIALEQVPAALPVWEATAAHLRALGYSAWTGKLDAADYGAPQVRRRAILIASRVREAAPPAPTHAADPGEAALFGPALARHVSMAQALGWGYTQRPAPTVTGGGTATGGPEPFGNGTRQAMRRAMPDPDLWLPRPGEGHAANHIGLTQAEAAVLQTFPADYPFQGRKGAVALQIGNAVAPLLALHVLSAATGIVLEPGATKYPIPADAVRPYSLPKEA